MAPRRRARRGRGRPLLLDAEKHEQLVKSTRGGSPLEVAAEAAGVSRTAFAEWLSKGRDEEDRLADEGGPPDPRQEVFLNLWLDVRQARAEAAQRNILTVQKVAQGGTITERIKERLPDGTVRETEKRQPPDWRAAAWYLEKQHANHFSKEAALVQVTGAAGGPIEIAHADPEEVAARVTANIAALVQGAPRALAGADSDVVDADVVDGDESA